MVKARLAVAAVQPHADAGTTAKRKYDENAQQAWPIGHRGRGARHTAGGALGQEKSFKQQLIGTWSLMSPEEAKALGIGTLAYYGTDTVNERDQTITEKLKASTFPNQLTVEQKRTVTAISATSMHFSNHAAVGGGQIAFEWQRVK